MKAINKLKLFAIFCLPLVVTSCAEIETLNMRFIPQGGSRYVIEVKQHSDVILSVDYNENQECFSVFFPRMNRSAFLTWGIDGNIELINSFVANENVLQTRVVEFGLYQQGHPFRITDRLYEYKDGVENIYHHGIYRIWNGGDRDNYSDIWYDHGQITTKDAFLKKYKTHSFPIPRIYYLRSGNYKKIENVLNLDLSALNF